MVSENSITKTKWWLNPGNMPTPKAGDMATFGGKFYGIKELTEDKHSPGSFWAEVEEVVPIFYKLEPVEQSWE